MADVKISALPAAPSVALADLVPIVHSGATDQATVTQLRAALMPVSLTADVSGTLPAGSQAAQAMGGDCSGTTASCTVGKIKGTTVTTAGGGLTTGAVLRVTGAAVCDYGPVDLANAAAVTGVLPAANQAAQTLAGDVTGPAGTTVAGKVRGTTVGTAGGALTTGAVFRVTGPSTIDYGTVDLANAAAVTGVLPTGNQAAQTLGGDASGTTAAVVNTQARGLKSATTTVSVSGATAPTAGQVLTAQNGTTASWVTPAGGAVGGSTTQVLFNDAGTESGNAAFTFAKATGVVTATAYALGATPATTGGFRAPTTIEALVGRNAANTGDLVYMATDASDNLMIGTATDFASRRFGTIYINPGSAINLGAGGATWFSVSAASCTFSNTVYCAAPILGNGAVFGVHGNATLQLPDGAYTEVAAQYSCYRITYTSGLRTAAANVVFPSPSAGQGYEKFIFNNSGFTIHLSTGAGTTRDLVTGQANKFWFDSTGVTYASGATWVP